MCTTKEERQKSWIAKIKCNSWWCRLGWGEQTNVMPCYVWAIVFVLFWPLTGHTHRSHPRNTIKNIASFRLSFAFIQFMCVCVYCARPLSACLVCTHHISCFVNMPCVWCMGRSCDCILAFPAAASLYRCKDSHQLLVESRVNRTQHLQAIESFNVFRAPQRKPLSFVRPILFKWTWMCVKMYRAIDLFEITK